jgi:CheY-like chemotaxis protein
MLKQRGYTVLEARDGINAQVVSRGHFGPIDLLLTDVVMPQKSGPEAAKELLSDRPHMKVLYMSGYPDHPVFSHGPLDKGRLLLQKPFTPETLVRKVREVLDMPAEEFKNTHLVG